MPGGGHALRDVLVDAAARRIAFEPVAKIVPEAGLSLLVQRKLARGQEAHFVHLVDRALGVGVETADALHDVVVELDAVGQSAAHGEKVDQPAAHAVFAGGDDLRDVRVAGGHELPPQIVRRQLRALLEVERAGGEIFDRRQAIERRGDRHDHDVELSVA